MEASDMKTYKIFGLMLVTGDKDGKVAKLAAGTHFLTAYGNKRGGPRKRKEPGVIELQRAVDATGSTTVQPQEPRQATGR
jgi:hypothetical protein